MTELIVEGWQIPGSLEGARLAAKIELVPVELLEGDETAAFEIAVNDVIAGRWWRTKSKGCEVTWQSGIGVRAISVPDVGDDPDLIAAVIRPMIPPVRLVRLLRQGGFTEDDLAFAYKETDGMLILLALVLRRLYGSS